VGTIAEGLDAPWSIVRLESGSTLISERDRGVVRWRIEDGLLVSPRGRGAAVGG